LCELLEHLPKIGHNANAITALVTMKLEDLLSGLGTARLDTGTKITAGEARRLACNAALVPAVLGSDSVPLDLGREVRLHTKDQRRALAILHDTCAIDGCERPFAWCESTTLSPGPAEDEPTSTTHYPSAPSTTNAPTTTASPCTATFTAAGASAHADRPTNRSRVVGQRTPLGPSVSKPRATAGPGPPPAPPRPTSPGLDKLDHRGSPPVETGCSVTLPLPRPR
jgi:hypothetical protein